MPLSIVFFRPLLRARLSIISRIIHYCSSLQSLLLLLDDDYSTDDHSLCMMMMMMMLKKKGNRREGLSCTQHTHTHEYLSKV